MLCRVFLFQGSESYEPNDLSCSRPRQIDWLSAGVPGRPTGAAHPPGMLTRRPLSTSILAGMFAAGI